MTLKQINSIDDIPRNTKIAIYGCGETGKDLFYKLNEARKDICIDFFIDSSSEFKLFDRDVLRYSESNLARINSVDFILIASAFWASIYNGLYSSTASKAQILSSYFMHSNSPLKELGGFYFDADEKINYELHFQKIAQKLPPEDHKLLRALFELRAGTSDHAPDFFLSYERKGLPYVDFGMTDFCGAIIEAGTFDGTDTVRLSECSPLARIYSFDPSLDALKNGPHYKNIIENKNITVLQAALDKESGVVYFNEGGSQTSKDRNLNSGHGIKIHAITLDEFVIQNSINKVDFIKMDIEGGEISALLGGASIIKKHRPKIAISIYHRKDDLYKIPMIMDELIGSHSLRLGHYTSSFVDSILYVIPN